MKIGNDNLDRLWSGDSGLAKSYWVWGVLAGIPWVLVLSLVKPGSRYAIAAVIFYVIYYVIVHVGVWRAASKYQGPRVWAVLAKVAVAIIPVCLVVGTLIAVLVGVVAPTASQSSQKLFSIINHQKTDSSKGDVGQDPNFGNDKKERIADYGLAIKSREEYQNAVNSYRLKIRTGEAHVFDAFPIQYLQSEEKAWPKEEVPKIGFLWWYEGDDIFMVLINNHPRIPIEKVLLGMNYGSCGSADQTKYPVDLGASIKPGYFAVAKLSNDALFKFAYQVKDGLNSEEQERWRSDRKEKNDCIDIKDAWFKF